MTQSMSLRSSGIVTGGACSTNQDCKGLICLPSSAPRVVPEYATCVNRKCICQYGLSL